MQQHRKSHYVREDLHSRALCVHNDVVARLAEKEEVLVLFLEVHAHVAFDAIGADGSLRRPLRKLRHCVVHELCLLMARQLVLEERMEAWHLEVLPLHDVPTIVLGLGGLAGRILRILRNLRGAWVHDPSLPRPLPLLPQHGHGLPSSRRDLARPSRRPSNLEDLHTAGRRYTAKRRCFRCKLICNVRTAF